MGLIVSERLASPGHGIQKVMRSVTPNLYGGNAALIPAD